MGSGTVEGGEDLDAISQASVGLGGSVPRWIKRSCSGSMDRRVEINEEHLS